MGKRLLLSYVALIAGTVAVLAVIINVVTASTFSRYLTEQAAQHSHMLPVMLAGYHARHGGWAGVQANIDEAGVLIGAEVSLADDQERIVAATRRELVGGPAAPELALGLSTPVWGSRGSRIGTLYVGRSVAQQRVDAAFLATVTRMLAVTGMAVGIGAAILGWVMARSISRPLAEMGRAAVRIARGDYGVQVSAGGSDEIAALGRAFNRMAADMAGVEALRRRLVADVSHELRTPLTVIRGYLESLRFGQISDRQSAEGAFAAMHAETNRLLRLVDDLRQVSALDAGLLALERRPTDLAAVVSGVVSRLAPRARKQGLRLVSDLPGTLPPIGADPERIAQVVLNLLDNALQHTPRGGEVRVTGGDDGAWVWLSVADTGVGIAPEHLPHIFERFYRVDRARSRTGEGGTGIGLAIVRAIAAAHGGTVSVTSALGQGSTFTLRLPRGTGGEPLANL